MLRGLEQSKELLKQKNRRLARLYKTAQRFVDNVSHEFRTPLTVIKEYATLICDGLAGDVNDEQQRMLNIVVDRADDLNTMVDDMLDVSKVEAGMLGAWRRNCRVADVVRHVMPALALKAQVHGVKLETDVSPRLPAVYCDGEKLGRAIINLTVNGIKFSRQPGVVRLWVQDQPEAREVVVGITDNGPGIDEEQQTAIFKRFKQLDTNIRRSTKGFGLGLCIAKELIELNLGTMNMVSKVGQGSTFSLTVPWADPIEVTTRYLKQLAVQPRKSPTVSLLRAEVDEAVDDSLCNDADAFELFAAAQRSDVPRRPAAVVVAFADAGGRTGAVHGTGREVAAHGQPKSTARAVAENPLCQGRSVGRIGHRTRSWSKFAASPYWRKLMPERARILIVDDDPDIAFGTGLRLRAAGYETLAACDGREGIDCARQTHPDAILLDVRMPRLDGLDALDELKSCRDTQCIPVIMLSASMRDRRSALDHGARFFLNKPFHSSDLLEAVQMALREKSRDPGESPLENP